jgi:zinc protease
LLQNFSCREGLQDLQAAYRILAMTNQHGRRSCVLLFFLWVVFMSIGVSASQASDARLHVLKNGMQILVKEDRRFPLAALRLYANAGAAYEDEANAGVSHLLEHMVFKGSENSAPGEIAERIESAGGYLNAATSFDYTVYIVDLPKEHLLLGLDTLKEMSFNATIDPEELESEKKVVISELERGEDSPESLLFKTMQSSVWKGTSYERPIIGSRETVNGLSRQDIMDYIDAKYQPSTMLLVVVGDVDADEVIREADKRFGMITAKKDAETLTPLSFPYETSAQAETIVKTGPWKKAYVSVAFPLPSLHNEADPALEVLSFLLGGDKSSQLYRRFKYDLQLVDEISVSTLTLKQLGVFYIFAVMDADKVPAYRNALEEELAKLKAADFSKQELDRAKLNIEDSLFGAKETLSGLAGKLGWFQFFEGAYHAEENYLYDIRHVGESSLDEAIGSYLRKERMHTVILAPEDKEEAVSQAPKDMKWERPAEGLPVHEHGQQEAAGAVEVLDLGAGRHLVLIPDRSLPYTSLQIAFRGGDALLADEEQGLAELSSRILTKGSLAKGAVMSHTDIEDFLADRASWLSASVGREIFMVSTRFPTRFAEDMYGLLENILLHPAYEDDDTERAKRDLVTAIKRREDRPTSLMFRRLFPHMYADGPYGRLHMGEIDDVQGYDAADARGFWDKQKERPWIMSVCGDFDREAVLKTANTLLENFGTQFEAMVFPQGLRKEPAPLELHLADRNQAHLMVVFPVPGMTHPDATGLQVLRTVLSGQGGILFRELRDKKGLGYTVTAFHWEAVNTGLFMLYIGTSPEGLEESLEGFREQVAVLKAEPLSDEVVDRAKNLLRGDFIRSRQSLSARSREAASYMVRGLPADYGAIFPEEAAKVTTEDLKNLAQKYLDWDKASIVRVVP